MRETLVVGPMRDTMRDTFRLPSDYNGHFQLQEGDPLVYEKRDWAANGKVSGHPGELTPHRAHAIHMLFR